jgi:hypothetical protein
MAMIYRRIVALLLLACLTACSVAMSASRSTFKGDPAMFQVGADRSVLESTFGPPNITASLDGGRAKVAYKVDPDAHREGSKAAAVAGHVAMDILTFGLWEVIGTPLELAAQDKFTNYILTYGPDQKDADGRSRPVIARLLGESRKMYVARPNRLELTTCSP